MRITISLKFARPTGVEHDARITALVDRQGITELMMVCPEGGLPLKSDEMDAALRMLRKAYELEKVGTATPQEQRR